MIENRDVPFLFLPGMSYQETIDYLFSRLPQFSRIGAAAYKANLSNTIRLCEELNSPQQQFKSIHVAGTNGKGSVSHMLAAVFHMAGYKTGLYTSPHLKDFRERIKVNIQAVQAGRADKNSYSFREVDEMFVIEFTEKMKPLIEEIDPSFFEITVAMAFEYFARQEVDIAIIEVGLGGRLDSTNIITPELSIITNIGWDHMNLLGDSLEKIAFEKAGIIKPGVPVIVGEVINETAPVFEKTATEKNAFLSIASQKRQVTNWSWKKNELIAEVNETHQIDHKIYHLDLPGLYQTKNLLTVLEACSQLQQQGWKIDDETIHKGLRQVKKLTAFHGRWDVLQHYPTVVLDVAHNEDGIRQLTEQIELTDHHELHIVLGMAKDKAIESVLDLLPRSAHYYFTRANIPRALDPEILLQQAKARQLKGNTYENVNTALSAAKANAAKNDLVIVCGSVFLIGDIDSIR